MATQLRLALLGSTRFNLDDAPLRGFISGKVQALLAYLAVTGTAHTRQSLAGLLWGEMTEEAARASLRVAVSNLRRLLPSGLLVGRQSLSLNTDASYWLDVDDFKSALSAKRPDTPEEEIARLRAGVELYRGDFMDGVYVREARMFEEWVLGQREQLRRLQLQALYRLAVLLANRGEYTAGIHYLERLLELEPWQEEAHAQMMRLLAASGRRSEALAQYETCRRVLAADIGVEPASATQRLYQQIRTMEVEQPLVVRPPAHRVAAQPLVVLVDAPQGRPQIQVDSDAPWGSAGPPDDSASGGFGDARPAPGETPDSYPFVGFRRQQDALLSAWSIATSKGARLALLAGEMGSGKTRLAEEFLRWATGRGITTAGARLYAGEETLSFVALPAWLRSPAISPTLARLDPARLAQVAWLVPTLAAEHPDVPRPGRFSENWERLKLFEALANAALGDGGARVLLLDGLQWCDLDTLQWLLYLLRQAVGTPLLILATSRTEEPVRSEVAWFLSELRQMDLLTEIEMEPFDRDETAALAEQVIGGKLNSEQAEWLYRESEGVPLYVVEFAAEVKANALSIYGPADAGMSPDGRGVEMPARLKAALAARMAQLSPAARELAGLIAGLGRSVSVETLERIWHSDEEKLVLGIEELCQRRILREVGQGSYTFSHNKLQQVALSGISAARRRLLQRSLDMSGGTPSLFGAPRFR